MFWQPTRYQAKIHGWGPDREKVMTHMTYMWYCLLQYSIKPSTRGWDWMARLVSVAIWQFHPWHLTGQATENPNRPGGIREAWPLGAWEIGEFVLLWLVSAAVAWQSKLELRTIVRLCVSLFTVSFFTYKDLYRGKLDRCAWCAIERVLFMDTYRYNHVPIVVVVVVVWYVYYTDTWMYIYM